MRQSEDPAVAERIADFLIGAGIYLAALAPIVLLIEIVEWMVMGHWPGWSVEDGLLFVGLDEPLAHFSLVQFALDIATDLPLAIGLYLAGLATFFGALKIVPDQGLSRRR
jgi:hypothetical protein